MIAQLGERQTEDLKVPGSIPGRGIFFPKFIWLFLIKNIVFKTFLYVKVSKSRKQFIYGLLNSHKKRTKLTILSIFFTQDSELRSFFGRIKEIINCFRDLLTFNWRNKRDKIE